MKKHCFLIFHDWTVWSVDSDREVNVFWDDDSRLPDYRLRIVIQVRQCNVCQQKEYKRTEFKS